MAKKKVVENDVKEIQLSDVVKHIYRGDIVKYVNEHPECGLTSIQLINYFQEQGYFVINL